MSQFQTLIKSRASPLNIKTLILVVFIDTTMVMPELTNGWVENVPCTSKTPKSSSVYNVCCIFEDFDTFYWVILILYPGHTSLLPETGTLKFMGLRDQEAQC